MDQLPEELLLRFEGVLLDGLQEKTHECTTECVSMDPPIYIQSDIGYIPFLVDVYSYPLSKSRRYIAKENFGYYTLIALHEDPLPVSDLTLYAPRLDYKERPIMCNRKYTTNHFILGALIHLVGGKLFEGERIRIVIETHVPNHLITNPITILTSELVQTPKGLFIPSEYLL